MKNHYSDGWHEVKNSSLSFYVEDGKVLRGTTGEGTSYRPVYPYRYSKKQDCYIIVTPTAYKGVLSTLTWK